MDVHDALREIASTLLPGDLVLCKASRSIGIDRLVDALVSGTVPKDGSLTLD